MASEAKILPLEPGDRSERAKNLLAQLTPDGRRMNVFNTLLRNEGLFARWTPFLGKLLAGKLPARDREILILRTAQLCGSAYEWGQHDIIGRRAGLTHADLLRIVAGPDAAGWSPTEWLLMQAADEMHEHCAVSDPTWAGLASRYDEAQLIEIPMVVGHYHMVAFVLNSLRVEAEPGLPGFPATSN
jgi:4-carboxymuconolactone decarboxylase